MTILLLIGREFCVALASLTFCDLIGLRNTFAAFVGIGAGRALGHLKGSNSPDQPLPNVLEYTLTQHNMKRSTRILGRRPFKIYLLASVAPVFFDRKRLGTVQFRLGKYGFDP
ncbi:hypothetical protein C7974DRAFT_383590 [Boeremia exigua]|uniref:uncharacterized protein n=1 Tax=Boeremia exigua TaxID=749465 RepID=UPI001E8E3C44|nr:uncharacterized protein C7974DRAFT_383590 [Boeremia exigua]KAH6644454.1 hypothetical protein C7974DRAFT_383590 [Boeremia exigua]